MEQGIYLIESPRIYEYLSDTRYGHVQKEYLRYLMSPNIYTNGSNGFKGEEREYLAEQLKDSTAGRLIAGRLEEVMGGRAEFLQNVGLEFKDRHLPEPVHSVSVSTGLKSLSLLEYVLRTGAIEEKDILIVEEPETNLHPLWQLTYAKTLAELQAEFHLKILITTHSPYFLQAMEVFTDMEDCMDQLNVHRMERNAEDGKVLLKMSPAVKLA